jgi:hypothetical protein
MGGMAWIVDKSSPNVPIIKVTRHDFNLYKSGIYRSRGNKVEFNGVTFWLPDDVYSRLKVKLKSSPARLGNLAISMQEFMNRELVENLPYSLNHAMVDSLKNNVDDIYLVCPRQTERAYASHIERLEADLAKLGITLKGKYYLSETFHNHTDDSMVYRRARLLIQHLVGRRTDKGAFTEGEVALYKKIIVYDTSRSILLLSKEMNPVLRDLLSKTPEGVTRVVKENVDDHKPKLEIKWLTGNEANSVVTEKVDLDYSALIRHFESFMVNRR